MYKTSVYTLVNGNI